MDKLFARSALKVLAKIQRLKDYSARSGTPTRAPKKLDEVKMLAFYQKTPLKG